MRTIQKSRERRNTSNVVNNWMSSMDNGPASPPQEQDRSVVDQLEKRRLHRRKSQLSRLGRNLSYTRSFASDPEEFRANNNFLSPTTLAVKSSEATHSRIDEPAQQTDADDDDELFTTENGDVDGSSLELRSPTAEVGKPLAQPQPVKSTDYFARHSPRKKQAQETSKFPVPPADARFDERPRSQPGSNPASPSRTSPKTCAKPHLRNISTATIVYNPVEDLIQEDR